MLAQSMALCPLDHLFLRMGVADSMLKNQSSSSIEQKQTQYIIDYATDNSLILLDEIGNLQNFDRNLTSTNIFKLLSHKTAMC